jgi:hypothetical protein
MQGFRFVLSGYVNAEEGKDDFWRRHLTKLRAVAARKFLVAEGVDADRLFATDRLVGPMLNNAGNPETPSVGIINLMNASIPAPARTKSGGEGNGDSWVRSSTKS